MSVKLTMIANIPLSLFWEKQNSLRRLLGRSCSFKIIVLLMSIPLLIHPLYARQDSLQRDRTSTNHNLNQGGVGRVEKVPVYTYEVVNSWPHDRTAFTQGLVFLDGWLYESTGHYGSSTLRKIDIRNGQVTKTISLSEKCFAEGLTIFQGKIFQLTWTDHRGFIYDLKSLKLEREFRFEGEGWGLTADGSSLITSDGTNQIRFLDPMTLRTIRSIRVTDNKEPVMDINELEFIKGEIYANVWKSDRIARIDPHDGTLLGWIDLSGLLPLADHPGSEDVLNGIAYDDKNDRLFVTGKRWPKIFEIRLKLRSELRL